MANATTKKTRWGLNATATVAGTALLLGGGIAVASAALPVGSAGTVTANNHTGSWSPADLVALKLHSDMACPTVGGMMAGALIFMSEVGQEIKPATSATEAQNLYPFTQDPMSQMSLTGTAIADDNNLESGFVDGTKAPIADMTAVVQASHTYSIGYVCTVLSDDFRTATINPVGGTTVASWATLTTDASKNWTISQPVVATPTPTATPSDTETASPSPSATPSATETATPSASASPSGTPSATESVAPTTGVTVPATTSADAQALKAGDQLSIGQKYVVNAPSNTFAAGETVSGEIHSDPILLAETAVAGSDGSVSYTFSVPASLPAGTHTLILKGASGATFQVAGLIVTASANAPFLADTNWVRTATANPASSAGLAAMVIGGLTLVGVGGGIYLSRRRKGSRV
ncbi:hypothetical protein GCM10023063_43250 [Arthrobacter methylotrophus]|uniref:LPXTG cell wall anchor domain-containing protein n=1 Tax=Arthrobacter methylotrophus TaxID=121291 RepID=A0ABV5UMV3_9MICC